MQLQLWRSIGFGLNTTYIEFLAAPRNQLALEASRNLLRSVDKVNRKA